MKRFVIFSLNAHVMPFVRTELQLMDALTEKHIPVTRLRAANCTCRLVECVAGNSDGNFRCERCSLDQAVVRRTSPGCGMTVFQIICSLRMMVALKRFWGRCRLASFLGLVLTVFPLADVSV